MGSSPFGPPADDGPEHWFERARCAREKVDPEFFFPDSGTASARQAAFCRACPVAQQCLDYALDREQPSTAYGIYGGLTPAQRSSMR